MQNKKEHHVEDEQETAAMHFCFDWSASDVI